MQNCVAGVDDGFFEKEWSHTLLALVVYCGPRPVFLALAPVAIDGDDSTRAIVGLVERAAKATRELWGRGISAVLLDTTIFAGFNVADPAMIHGVTGLPVIAVHHYPPDEARIERALRRAFRDWSRRLQLLRSVWARLERISCEKGPLYIARYGLEAGEAWSIICGSQLYTRTPEPLYAAGVIASGFTRSLGPLTFKPGPETLSR